MFSLIAQTLPTAPSGAPSWVGEIAVYAAFGLALLAWFRTNALPEIKQDIAASKDLANTANTTASVAHSTAVAADATANQAVSAAAAAHTTAAVAAAGVATINAAANASGPATVPVTVSPAAAPVTH